MFDAKNGGFGQAPKFPHPGVLDLLMEHYERTGDVQVKNAFLTTLERMAKGGVYDQLAGISVRTLTAPSTARGRRTDHDPDQQGPKKELML